MDIVFESAVEFEQDLKIYSEAEQSLILQQLHEYSSLLLTDKSCRERKLHQFYSFEFKENYGSSLYSFIVNYYLRVILTIDEDPLFNRVVITLFRVTDIQNVARIYQQVGESIYQSFLPYSQPTEVQLTNGKTLIAR